MLKVSGAMFVFFIVVFAVVIVAFAGLLGGPADTEGELLLQGVEVIFDLAKNAP